MQTGWWWRIGYSLHLFSQGRLLGNRKILPATRWLLQFPLPSHSVKHICSLESGRVRAQTLLREATSLSFSCPFTTSCSLYGNLGGRYTSVTWARIALDYNQLKLGATRFEGWNHCDMYKFVHITGQGQNFLVRFPGLFSLCIYNR